MNHVEHTLSIIVPIYNVEKYLRQCLDSLVNQTVQDFFVIMVNDGSKDNSGMIAQEYAAKYPEQFIYIYQENAGLGAARNTGMKHCHTPFIEFLDSDDWLLPRSVELVLLRIKKEHETPDIIFMTPVVYDMSTCRFSEFMDNDRLRNIFSNALITNAQQIPDMYSLEPNINRCVWNFHFLKKYTFTFPEGVKWEDVSPHFYIFYWARRCILVDYAGFCYRINSGNQITTSSDKGRLDIIPVFSEALIFAFNNNWSKHDVSHIIRMLVSFAIWSMNMTKKDVYRELILQLHILFKTIPKRYWKTYQYDFIPTKPERLLTGIIRSSSYRILLNYHAKEFGMQIIRKIRQPRRRKKRHA